MNALTLKQLKYFEALARHGHFGRAAEAVAVSQPALSVQIKEMEQALGLPLFERSARQVRLTAFGEAFRERAAGILRGVDELGDLARAWKDRLEGRLRLGVIPTIAPYLLPRILATLSDSHAGLDVHVRESQTARLVEELLDGRLDCAIVALPVKNAALTEVALFSEHMVLVQPCGEAAAPSRDVLRNKRLLLLEEGHCFRDQALDFCNFPAGTPRDGLDGSSLSTLVQMVGAGIGVTLIPEMAVAVETRSAAVEVAHFDAPKPARTVGMIWRKSSPLADQMQGLADLVRETGQAMRTAVL